MGAHQAGHIYRVEWGINMELDTNGVGHSRTGTHIHKVEYIHGVECGDTHEEGHSRSTTHTRRRIHTWSEKWDTHT